MSLPDELLGRGLELIETHISWVFLGDDEVWKVKKPVDLGFLDFTTVDKRREYCEAELRLNQRLASDVYRDVVALRRDSAGRLHFGGSDDDELVDWAVRMKRLTDEDRADVRLADGRLTDEHVESIATRLARFHDTCEATPKTARFGSVDVIGGNVRENFEQTREVILDYVSADQANEIESWQTRFLHERAPTFASRVRDGHIRDGHGDLRLEHVYLDDAGGAAIIDCIEFNERFRYADVCADIVFLTMDFARCGRVDLAERFLALYAREANDYDLYPLVDFYESYRAFVRGKISAMIASNPHIGSRARERARRAARRYYLLALASERRPLLPPALIAVGGIIASGKSTIASRLAKELSVPVIDADRTRKFLAGVTPETPLPEGAWQGVYAEDFGERVYEEVRRRARSVLLTRRPVVLDASFRASAQRRAVRALAVALSVPFAFVECRVDADVCRDRLERREDGVSDGRLEIFDDFVRKWEPVTEIANEEHVAIDTARPIAESMAVLRQRLPVSFASLTS